MVDGLQMITSPAELTGPMAWVLEAGVDLVTMGVMIFFVGSHWAFLPSFVTKLLPFVDLAPTWTLAIFIATRDRRGLASSAFARLTAQKLSTPRASARSALGMITIGFG